MKTTLNNNLILKCLASAFAMIMFSACSKEKNRELAPAALYQENGMHPVSSSFNQKKQVISILYANEVAKNGVNTGNQKYTLVTWKQKPHPLWFGGNTNGEVLSVEKINLSKDLNGFTDIHYQKQSAPNGGEIEEMDVRKRIRYILEQKFSQFPN
jgi:phosphoribosyl-AMP cyclohydrolase